MSIPRLAAEEVVQAASPCAAEEAVSERIISDVVNNETSNNEYISKPSKAGQVPLEGNPKFIKDEIELTKMSINIEKECAEDDLIKIEGKFKNPKFKDNVGSHKKIWWYKRN